MPSPFPGMDPYLEGSLWPDVHQALATKIRQRLAPGIRPNYVARLAVRIIRDHEPEAEIGVMYPDVEVLHVHGRPDGDSERGIAETSAVMTPATLILTSYPAVEYRQITVEIRSTTSHRLVTVIELLSPVNKRGDGLIAYRRKRSRLRAAGVNLLEIDLLRRGTRPVAHPRLPNCDYLIALTRRKSARIALWPLSLRDSLPIVPVPLRKADGDVPLDMASVLAEIYDEAGYGIDMDYSQPPPPPGLTPEDAEWVRQITMR